MSILGEFREFAVKGNVVDMAAGIIIGGAFGKIVTSLVNDVLMPPIGVILGGVDFAELSITLKASAVDAAGVVTPAVTLNYGTFLQTVINFLIVAWALFILVKAINSLRRKQESLMKKG